jgi:hypothetical protein
MRLRLFNFAAAAVSLALCVTTATLWVRSYLVADQLTKPRADGYTTINSDRGVIAYVVDNDSPPPGSDASWRWYKAYRGTFGGGFDATAGSSTVDSIVGGTAYRQRAWWVHHWLIVLATAIFPSVRFGRWWRRRHAGRDRARRLRGQCPVCGYDLCATPARCPECGTVPKPVNPVAT